MIQRVDSACSKCIQRLARIIDIKITFTSYAHWSYSPEQMNRNVSHMKYKLLQISSFCTHATLKPIYHEQK